MSIDDTIQVCCSRCKLKFRDKARRVRAGYSRQCPSCECMIFFEDNSPKKEIDRAMRDAERVRKLLRDAEAEQALSRRASAKQQAEGESESDDSAPTTAGQMIGRRFTSGRAGRLGRS